MWDELKLARGATIDHEVAVIVCMSQSPDLDIKCLKQASRDRSEDQAHVVGLLGVARLHGAFIL
jgi:hypothetical protein